jgi:hypothetical protein
VANEAQKLASPIFEFREVSQIDLRKQAPRFERRDEPLGEGQVSP